MNSTIIRGLLCPKSATVISDICTGQVQNLHRSLLFFCVLVSFLFVDFRFYYSMFFFLLLLLRFCFSLFVLLFLVLLLFSLVVL